MMTTNFFVGDKNEKTTTTTTATKEAGDESNKSRRVKVTVLTWSRESLSQQATVDVSDVPILTWAREREDPVGPCCQTRAEPCNGARCSQDVKTLTKAECVDGSTSCLNKHQADSSRTQYLLRTGAKLSVPTKQLTQNTTMYIYVPYEVLVACDRLCVCKTYLTADNAYKARQCKPRSRSSRANSCYTVCTWYLHGEGGMETRKKNPV